jgi:hypothetical protein
LVLLCQPLQQQELISAEYYLLFVFFQYLQLCDPFCFSLKDIPEQGLKDIPEQAGSGMAYPSDTVWLGSANPISPLLPTRLLGLSLVGPQPEQQQSTPWNPDAGVPDNAEAFLLRGVRHPLVPADRA